VEVTVHERRSRQAALGLDDLGRIGVEPRSDPHEAAVLDSDVDDLLADAYVAKEEVHRVTVNGWRSLRTDPSTPR
jgi:hypothetical protein